MDNLRYLLAAIVALTLITSVVSGDDPSYLAGMNAFADEHNKDEGDNDDSNSGSSDNDEEQEDDGDNSGSGSDDEEDDDDKNKNNGRDEEIEDDGDKLVQSLGDNSRVTLEID